MRVQGLVLPLVVAAWTLPLVGALGAAGVRSSRRSFEASLELLRAQAQVVRLQRQLAREPAAPGPPPAAPARPEVPASPDAVAGGGPPRDLAAPGDPFARLDAATAGRP